MSDYYCSDNSSTDFQAGHSVLNEVLNVISDHDNDSGTSTPVVHSLTESISGSVTPDLLTGKSMLNEIGNQYVKMDDDSGSSTPAVLSNFLPDFGANLSALDGADDGMRIMPTSSYDISQIPSHVGIAGNVDHNDDDLAVHKKMISSIVDGLSVAAVTHVTSVKKRLNEEKENIIKGYQAKIAEMAQTHQNDVRNHQLSLALTVEEHKRKVFHLENVCERMGDSMYKKKNFFGAGYSVQRIFHIWHKTLIDNKAMRQLNKTVDRCHPRRVLGVCFAAFLKNCAKGRQIKMRHRAKQHTDLATQEVIIRYELDLAKLRHDLEEAHGAIHTEVAQRQNLEEDLKRLFLKNVTAMNMEALSLFQQQNLTQQAAQQQKAMLRAAGGYASVAEGVNTLLNVHEGGLAVNEACVTRANGVDSDVNGPVVHAPHPMPCVPGSLADEEDCPVVRSPHIPLPTPMSSVSEGRGSRSSPLDSRHSPLDSKHVTPAQSVIPSRIPPATHHTHTAVPARGHANNKNTPPVSVIRATSGGSLRTSKSASSAFGSNTIKRASPAKDSK